MSSWAGGWLAAIPLLIATIAILLAIERHAELEMKAKWKRYDDDDREKRWRENTVDTRR